MDRSEHWAPGDYATVERAIGFLERNFREQPTLEEVARSVNLSKFHFQRVFSRWAGISPKKFLQHLTLTLAHAKTLLDGSHTVLDATLESGLSGPGRLHDLFVSHESATPGEYKSWGAGMVIFFGMHPTPFGECLLAISDKGVCGLAFVEGGQRAAALDRLRRHWKNATLVEEPGRTGPVAGRIFGGAGRALPPPRLVVRGTPFQIKVWEALLKIPPGALACYGDVARAAGHAGAQRAAGGAIAENPIAYLIPCHRVIRKGGDIGQYRWGATRKKAMLAWEAARAEAVAG